MNYAEALAAADQAVATEARKLAEYVAAVETRVAAKAVVRAIAASAVKSKPL